MDLKPLKYFDSLYPPNTHERELKLLIPYIEQGLSVQLVGIPGCGKSNILRLLSYNKEARRHNYKDYEELLHFVYLDCSEITDKPLHDIIKFILVSLSFTLAERLKTEDSVKINNFLKEGLSHNDELMLFQSLKKSIDYLAIEKKISIYLMFDKFENIIPSITPQFFANLKSLRNLAKYRFGCIFSLKRPLEELIDPLILEGFDDLIAENIVYTSIKDVAWLDFRISYIEKASRKNIDENKKNELIVLTGGHSKLTKLAAEAIVTEDNTIDNLEEFLKNKTTIQKALLQIWENLTPAEQIALKKQTPYEEIEKDLPYLARSFLVDPKGISIPLFKNFVENTSIDNTSPLSYDDSKNEIFLGNTEISERLSSLEFKLLKYLLKNKGKICTKDEIINEVWNNQKSQEGVTDQALDQIFYRLRKKVETDPRNPKFIQTLKGTGYKLNQA